MHKKFAMVLGAVALLGSSVPAIAATLEFEFNIATRPLELNGVTTNIGAHTMRIVVEDTAPNLGSSFGDFMNFYDAEVFFDAPDIGLNNAEVTSDTFLYFGNGVVGFTDTVGTFFTIYSLANPDGSSVDNFDFGGVDGNASGFDLSNIDVPQTLFGMTFNELRTGNDIVFSTGDRITGGTTLRNRADSVSVAELSIAPVPLPAGFPMLLVGLAGLGWLGSRRRAVSAT